jgi:fibronectin type 3 domain-containing protein
MTTTYTDSGLSANTTYYYQVAASNSGGTSPAVTASDTTPPAAPTNITAVPGNTQVTLNWTAATSATGYLIQRGTASGGAYTTLKSSAPGVSFTDNGLTNGTTYYYVMASSNVNGTGTNSAERSAIPVSTVPVAPTGVTATPGNSQVVLNWNASAGATSYTVRRGTADGGPYTNLSTTVSGTTYTNTPATSGTTYYYMIAATNSGGTGANSAQVAATPLGGPPAAPTNLTATGTNSQVILTWNASSGATGYILKRGTASGQETTAVNSAITSTNYTDSGLTNGLTYYYVVSGSNSNGTSGNSNEVSAVPLQSYSEWAATAFPGQADPAVIGATADPDKDGFPNLIEYFFGISPNTSDGRSLLTCALDAQGNFVLTFPMAKNLSHVSYTVQQSTDLNTWTSTGVTPEVVSDQGTYYRMKVIVPQSTDKKLLLRVMVTQTGG